VRAATHFGRRKVHSFCTRTFKKQWFPVG
jgi:hypothetical protein